LSHRSIIAAFFNPVNRINQPPRPSARIIDHYQGRPSLPTIAPANATADEKSVGGKKTGGEKK
jgi:hypothetical protein